MTEPSDDDLKRSIESYISQYNMPVDQAREMAAVAWGLHPQVAENARINGRPPRTVEEIIAASARRRSERQDGSTDGSE